MLVSKKALHVRVEDWLQWLKGIGNVRLLDGIRQLCRIDATARKKVVCACICGWIPTSYTLADELAALALNLVNAQLNGRQVRIAPQLVRKLS